jgi:hypothetical protein
VHKLSAKRLGFGDRRVLGIDSGQGLLAADFTGVFQHRSVPLGH